MYPVEGVYALRSVMRIVEIENEIRENLFITCSWNMVAPLGIVTCSFGAYPLQRYCSWGIGHRCRSTNASWSLVNFQRTLTFFLAQL